MSGRPNDKRSSMFDRRATNLVNRVGMAEINRHIHILHTRGDVVAQIALCDDVDLRISRGEVENRFAHPTLRPDKQRAHRRFGHSTCPYPALSLREMKTTKSPGEGSKFICAPRIPRASYASASGLLRSSRTAAGVLHRTSLRAN